jgi:mRNA interferase RelE/StbE
VLGPSAILVYVEERLARDPMRLSKPLTGEFAGLRSAHNGDYRVLFRLDDEQQVVWVIRVDHRAHVYRRR